MNRAESFSNKTELRSLEHSLPMALLKARELAMTQFRPMLRRHNLTEQQWRVIRVLAAFPEIDASELANRCYLLAPSLTRILQYLETQKVIRRIPDATDLRRAYFSLTPKGQRLFKKVSPDSEMIYQQISDSFGHNKLNTLYKLLAEFAAVLDQ